MKRAGFTNSLTFLLLLLVLLSSPAFADERGSLAPGARLESIPLDSNVYSDLDILYVMAGKGTPSKARPWTKGEAAGILERLDRNTLPPSGRALYDEAASLINSGQRFNFNDGLGLDARIDLNLEAYAHSNQAFDAETDWVQGFETRRPMAKLAMGLSLDDFLYIYCDVQYGRNRFSYQDELVSTKTAFPEGIGAIVAPGKAGILSLCSPIYRESFLTNLLEHSYDFDFQWPKRSIATVGGQKWNISLARDKIAWGNGHSGNFIVDSHTDYNEYLRMVAFSEHFKYDWLNIFFETNPSSGEGADTGFKILMAHRLEFRIQDRLTIAISENVMYQNDIFYLRYVNPAFIYHNLNLRSMFNAIAHVELDWNFMNGFKLYGQYVLDQARAPNESTLQSDISGFLGGLEFAAFLGPGILHSSLEYAMTDPLLYRRDMVDFLMFRKYFTHGAPPGGPGYILALDYIGYQYGGDAQVLQWDAGYRLPGKGKLDFRAFGMRHGQVDFFFSHNLDGNNAGVANYNGTTPSGDEIRETLILGLSGHYGPLHLLRYLNLTIWASADWLGRRTWIRSTNSFRDQDSDLQFSAGASLSL